MNSINYVLLLVAATLGGGKAYLDYRLHRELDKIIETEKLPATYTETHVTLSGAIEINELNLTVFDTTPVQIKTLKLYDAYRFYDLTILPAHFRLTAQKIKLPVSETPSPPPPLLKMLGYAPYFLNTKELRGLGYPTLQIEVDLDVHRVTENQLDVEGAVRLKQVGRLSWSAHLNNVPPPAQWNATALTQLQLEALTLTYQDNSFIESVFSYLAQRNKSSVPALKQGLITKLTADLKQSGLEFHSSVVSSLQQFIQNPESLTFSFQPVAPLTVEGLNKMSPLNLPKQLGLKMSAS